MNHVTAREIIASRERHRAESQRRLDAALYPFIEPIFNCLLNLVTQRPGGHRKMKIHLVETAGSADRLVKAHTKAGAERYVRDSIKPAITARVPTQDELVTALHDGIQIEDATNDPQASIPEPSQSQE